MGLFSHVSFSHTHAWMSGVRCEATALNIGIDQVAKANKSTAKNNVKGGKNAIKVLNISNSIYTRKKTAKKRFTKGHLSSFTRFVRNVKREGGRTGKHATSIASERKGV